MDKKELKHLVDRYILPDYTEDEREYATWDKTDGSKEIFVVGDWDPGISVDDDVVYLHEGEPSEVKISLTEDARIEEALKNYEKDSKEGYNKYPTTVFPSIYAKNKEVVQNFKNDLDSLLAKYSDEVVVVNFNIEDDEH